MAGFLDAIRAAGLLVDESLIVPGDYTRVGGRKAMAELLNRSNPPTAVVCANDLSALGALEEAQLRGHKVPQSVSIVGFDDIDEAVHAAPPLTTIRLSPHEIGVVAAQKLIERLNGREESSSTFLNGELIVRKSTASPFDPTAS
jgi:DNA-binding LacI/PurR family transcriptional regulator